MLSLFLSLSPIFGAESAGETKGGIAALGVDGKALVLQIITFVLIFVLLKRYALDKIMKTLEARNRTIDDSVKLGQELAKEKDNLQEKIEKMFSDARVEADKIIAAGHKDAGDVMKAAEEAAARKTETLIADAHAKISDDIAKARKDLEKEILSLVAEATEAVVGQKLDKAKDSQLIKRELDKVGSRG